MTCLRCRIDLPSYLTHDSPEECITTLRGRLDMKESELSAERRRTDSLAARVDAWKLKAKVQSPSNAGSVNSRMDKVENRCEYSAKKLKDIEQRLERAEQRAAFAVKQVEFMQQRRAS